MRNSLFVLLTLISVQIYGQIYEPLELAEKIFSKEPFPDIKQYIENYELDDHGGNLNDNVEVKFLFLGEMDNEAVVNMTVFDDSSSGGYDCYLYFRKDLIWKMYAIRSLALTGMIYTIKQHLEQMTPEEISSIIKRNEENDYAIFSSREEYDFMLGNAKLIIELDDNIIKHFSDNKVEFERLKDLAFQELKKTTYKKGDKSVSLIEELRSNYQKLYISSVKFGDTEIGDYLIFLIGGILDNTVGYIYIPPGDSIPKMNSSGLIMVRAIRDGWYMFKTT
jgi:hypothetical protein